MGETKYPDNLLNPMYPIALRVSGTLFKTYVFRQRGWWRDIMAYYYPYNPQTYKQQSWRNVFAYAVAEWQGFDDDVRLYYHRLRYPTQMSGYNRFIRYYLIKYKESL